jgi:peptidyl-prolyl cis-trans isomerase D
LSEDELKSFFENNKDKYIIPEKMKFSYVIFDPAKFKKDITIEEEQMKDYYEANQEKFKEPEKVKARHILLKIDQPKKEAEIKKKAMEIYKKAKEGADFAKLASQHSQDPKTKEKGGDLGYFPRGVMVKEFEDVAFGLKPGEISEPIKTQFGFHIIKVEDKKEEGIKDFDSAKPEITKILTEQAAFEKAYEEAMRFVDGISPNMDLGQYAASKGLKLITTNLISRKDKFPIQGLQEKQIDHLFSLGENEVSDVLTVQNRYYVFKAIEKVASHNAEFEEVKDQVNQDLKTQKAKELATSDAKKALQLLKEGKSLDDVAKQFKLEIKSSDFVRRNQPVEFIGYVPALMEGVFKLSKEKPVPEDIVDSEKGPVVFVLQDKKQAELENVQQEKQRVEAIFLKQQQDWLFANWLENERKKAKVEIHKDLL